MTQQGESTKTTHRIDRLLRSLVGVADVRMVCTGDTLRSVHILRDARVQPHQLIRNIISGLQAAFGIHLLPTQVNVHEDRGVFDAIAIAAEVLVAPEPKTATAPAAPPATAPAAANGTHANGNGNGGATNGNGNSHAHGNGHANGNGAANGSGRTHAAAPARDLTGRARPTRAPGPLIGRDVIDHAPLGTRTPESAHVIAAATEILRTHNEKADTAGLTLERVEFERRGLMVRCRTSLALNGRIYSAIAELPDSATAEAELAARVAVDALRVGGLTEAMLEGVGFISIKSTNYCVVTVREGSKPPRAGTAPMLDSMAASATAAALTALGSFTDARTNRRPRARHSTNPNA